VVKGVKMASAKSETCIVATTEQDDVKMDLTPETTDFSKPAIIGRMEASVLGVAQACSTLKEYTDKLLADLPLSTQLIRAMHDANAKNPCFGLAAFAQQLARRQASDQQFDALLAALDLLREVWRTTPKLRECTQEQLDHIQRLTNKVLCARYHLN